MPPIEAYRPASEPNPPQDAGVDPKELLAILWRRRWTILTTVVVVTTLAVLLGLRVTPKYTATTLLVIDPRQAKVVATEAVMQGLTPDSSTVETQVRVIESPVQLARVMEALRLFDDPEFDPAVARPGEVALKVSGLLEAVLGWLPGEWLIATGLAKELAPAAAEMAPERRREAAIERFGAGLNVAQEGRSFVIGLSFTSTDPDKAARVANALAELYVQDQIDAKLTGTKKAVGFLGDRLLALRDEVQKAEAAVEDFRRQHNLVSTEGVSLRERDLSDLSRGLIAARTRLAEQQAKLQMTRELRVRGGRDLDTVGDVIGSQVIINLRQQEALLNKEESELKAQYGDRHPRMLTLITEKENLQDKVRREVDRIVKGLENEVKVLATGVGTIEREIEQLKQQTVVDNEAAVRLRELEREAQASRQLYESFLERFKDAREQQDVIEADARVVSPAAAPTQPSTRGPKLFGAVGFTASLALGGLLALLREWLDGTLRSTRQAEQALGLPVLSLVPRLKGHQKPHRYLLAKPLSAYAEAIRSVHAALQPAGVENPPKVFLVTSALPEEGKTTLALSLAAYAASCGQRALLVDVDLRHPSVHRSLNTAAAPEAGLVELATGERTLDEVVRLDPETSVWYLPIRRRTAHPSSLLGSQKLRLLLQQLRERFDFIVLDSAPLLGVTDGKVAAHLADEAVLAARWGKTPKNAVAQALAGIEGVNVAGAVLTQVDLRKHAKDRYGDAGQYYGKYQRYYLN
jgi:capsular exopolysaccharide synthesis family protein